MRTAGGAFLLVTTSLWALAGTAVAATVKDGADAWQHGDYATAVGIWQPLADQGDGDAAFDMAQAYKLGRGVPTDLGKAKTLYGVAAKAGHPQGAANYGLLLFQDGDRKEAMPWIEKAAMAGDPRAQYVYGTALFNGDLATRDWPRAYGLMTRAAAAGLPQATTSLAQMDQFLSPADKQAGLAQAASLAAQPVPPLGRTMVTGDAPTRQAAPVRVAAVATAPAPKPARVKPMVPMPAPVQPAPARPAPAPVVARAVQPDEPSTTGGNWQVQLGAFKTKEAASVAWSKLGGATGGKRPSYEAAGAFVRLRTGGFRDRPAAIKYCAAVKAAGGACLPVPM